MPSPIEITNRLLLALPETDWALLSSRLEPITLSVRQRLEQITEPVAYVYFIQQGLASMVAQMPSGKSAEIGIVGREGATGLSLAIEDSQSSFETFIQMEGSALRIDAADFACALEQSPALRLLAMRYSKALWVQCAYTALANSVTRLEARLARWLLMVHDRIDGDRFELTHDFMAVMLAVRRPGVTVALHELEGKALIRSTRGTVTIRDRPGLIEMADGVYTLPEREYERLVGIRLMRESREAGPARSTRSFSERPLG
jgi:CRP-like cAMP-binding protein